MLHRLSVCRYPVRSCKTASLQLSFLSASPVVPLLFMGVDGNVRRTSAPPFSPKLFRSGVPDGCGCCADLGNYIDIMPQSRRSVPLSWFETGRLPGFVPLVEPDAPLEVLWRMKEEEEDPHRSRGSWGVHHSSVLTPVPFYTLHKLLNKKHAGKGQAWWLWTVEPVECNWRAVR